MRLHPVVMPLLLTLLLPFAAPAASAKDTPVRDEISADLADARKEVRAELAAAVANWKPTTWSSAPMSISASPTSALPMLIAPC